MELLYLIFFGKVTVQQQNFKVCNLKKGTVLITKCYKQCIPLCACAVGGGGGICVILLQLWPLGLCTSFLDFGFPLNYSEYSCFKWTGDFGVAIAFP